MTPIYALVFTLSIVLIEPWGNGRGEIWTVTKVLALLVICLWNLSILWRDRETLTIPKNWKISSLLWAVFLGIGILSTVLSPFPFRALLGQEQLGDGLLYWLLLSGFTLSNTLLLRHHPEILQNQFKGLIIGGVILAFSVTTQAAVGVIAGYQKTGQ